MTRPGATLNNNIRIIRSIQCCCCRMKGAATVRPAPTDSGRNVCHPSLRICTYSGMPCFREMRSTMPLWSRGRMRTRPMRRFRATPGMVFSAGPAPESSLARPSPSWWGCPWMSNWPARIRLRYAGIGPAYGPAQHPAPSPHPPASPIRAAAAAQMRTPTRRPPPPPARAGPRIRLPTPARRVHPSAH